MGYAHLKKQCRKCKKAKHVRAFYPKKGRTGRDSYCKPCRRAANERSSSGRAAKNAAAKKADPFYFRRAKLLKLYGLTLEQYDAMNAAQGGLCAICARPETRVLYGNQPYLSVDHDHATGKVRALLCHTCNSGLSRIEDSGFLEKAVAYLSCFK